ncbi:hypothetical protein GCM10011505_19420 [Tistrella bauzanensis]|uniref:SinR family protein n=1 Tax=Tistrella bauzanensis TaxID=657419 RepID=A0ABQ1IEZ6_9PROT|nr:hypothetical protein [Tistrella bauzanensis]GGB38001.1 hypothetical protein GCM10011505_19420 [Tistrella bauzanensis]
MAVYLVTYDLRAEGQSYDRLHKALASVAHAHAMENAWLLDLEATAEMVRGWLSQYLDDEVDRLLVTELKGDIAALNLGRGAEAWLQKRV